MGEVYKARDTRLARTVAIKVLPADTAADASARARFEREARAIATLSHPHICVVHDVGHQDGIDYLVMELLEGETLAERLARAKGPLPLDEVLKIGVAIADALDKAHRAGIVHRDLKPLNVMLTKSGPKLLDFGLAKLHSAASPVSLPTETAATTAGPATAKGTILGTIHYMAPEQVEGREADTRTDVWALGTLLYEMATGARPFNGESAASVIGAILKDTPPALSTRQPLTPPPFERLVSKCLSKDPDERWQSAKDLCDELKWISESGSRAVTVPAPAGAASAVRMGEHESGKRSQRWIFSAIAAALVGTIAGLGASRWNAATPTPPLVTRTDVALPPGVTEIGPSINNVDVSISADGRRVAYLAATNGIEQLYVRSLGQLEARLVLSGQTGDIRGPSMSPDGNWIAFLDENMNQLKRIPASGGTPASIGPALGAARGIVWVDEDTIIAATSDITTGLLRAPVAGGTPVVLTTPKPGEDHIFPAVLPGRNALLFTLAASAGVPSQIVTFDLGSGAQAPLISNGSTPRYSATGHLLYVADGALLAVPFDIASLKTRGEPVAVVSEVATKGVGAGQYVVSETGTLFYLHGKLGAVEKTLVWVDRQGREEVTGAPPKLYASAKVSPDGTRVAVDVREIRSSIWIWDLGRRILTPFSGAAGKNYLYPLWSPDGRRLAFRSEGGGEEIIASQSADGTGIPSAITSGRIPRYPLSFTPDGTGLLFFQPGAAPYDLGFAGSKQDGQASLILQERYNESNGVLSPDGKWLAYQSGESGIEEIYVRPFPDIDGGRWKVSLEGGTRPVWNRNGRELFYYLTPGKVFAVAVRQGNILSFDAPRLVVDGRYPAPYWVRQYDISPDGNRFLMLKAVADPLVGSSHLVIVQHWFEELNRLVPTK